jgi:hypothetical protein
MGTANFPTANLILSSVMAKIEVLRLPRRKAQLAEFHVMKIGATPARLVAVVRATDEQAALADVTARHRIPPHLRLIVLRTA